MRELAWMADARLQHTWNQTSALMALVANAHRDPKKTRPFKPADFNPLTNSSTVAAKTGVGILKQVFVDRQPREKQQP